MKATALLLAVGLGLAYPATTPGKEKKADPRIKQIHTVFVKDEHNDASTALRSNLEKWTCFKTAPSAEQADAVVSVLWSKEAKNSPLMDTSIQGAVARPLSIGENWAYRTTVVVDAREGAKFKKIWSKSLEQGQSDEQKQSGITKLAGALKADACGQP
jgi:hypothetical protein